MFPPTPNYNQQMFAYLQAWRQFLEQWAAMTAGLAFPITPSVWPTAPAGGQFLPPTAPFMPPFMPPTPPAPAPPTTLGPPAPADYTQQLFSYLQAWRQYLEQMTGPCAGSRPPRSPDGPNPPGDQTGSKTIPRSDVNKGSNAPRPPEQIDIPPGSPGVSFDRPPQLVDIPPASEYQSEFRRPGFDQPGPFDHGVEESQLLNPPDYAFGYRDRLRPETFPAGAVGHATESEASHTSEAPAQLPVNSPFSAVMARVEPSASPQSAPKSLFSTPGAKTASERSGEAGPENKQ
jgi:hypothetical protein